MCVSRDKQSDVTILMVSASVPCWEVSSTTRSDGDGHLLHRYVESGPAADKQIPFFGICIYLAHRFIRYDSPSQHNEPLTLREIIQRLDPLGCVMLAGWLGGGLTAISLVTNSTTGVPTWTDPIIIGLFTTCGLLFLVFLAWELAVVSYPLLPVELLKKRTPVAVAINNLALSAISFGLVSKCRILPVITFSFTPCHCSTQPSG